MRSAVSRRPSKKEIFVKARRGGLFSDLAAVWCREARIRTGTGENARGDFKSPMSTHSIIPAPVR